MSRIAFSAIFCLACVVSANCAAVEQEECAEVCPANYVPVCATDGSSFKEYSNSCVMNAANCRLRRSELKPFATTDDVWCQTTLVEELYEKLGGSGKPECLKPCPDIYAPVCIANDQYRATISSSCEIDNYNCLLETKDTSKHFRILKEEQC